MVDFSFIVSLYVSDLANVTKSTVHDHTVLYEYKYSVAPGSPGGGVGRKGGKGGNQSSITYF